MKKIDYTQCRSNFQHGILVWGGLRYNALNALIVNTTKYS